MGLDALEAIAEAARDQTVDESVRMDALGCLLDAYDPESATRESRFAGDVVSDLLGPTVRRVALRAARCLPAQLRDEFVEDAMSHVFVSRGSQGRPRICSFEARGATQGR